MNLTVDELVCLNRQVAMRQACPHRPAHEPVGEMVVRTYAPAAPRDVQDRIRAACQPRRWAGGEGGRA